MYHKHNVANDSTISEWFINYTGGFTKRGLIGQICIWFAENLNFSLRFTILIFQIIILFVYFNLLFLFFKKIKLNKIMLLSIFSPIFLLYPVAEIEVIARKEIFVFSFGRVIAEQHFLFAGRNVLHKGKSYLPTN